MGEAIVRLFAPNLIAVCVNGREGGDYTGEFWNQYSTQPAPFRSMTDLVFQMEALYDEWNFPQRSTNCRTFGAAAEQEERTPNPKRGSKMGLHNVQDKRGKQGTFIVQVQYRQNSTWQGQVIWAEENKREHFRSAFELMKLIDSAMDDGVMQQQTEVNAS